MTTATAPVRTSVRARGPTPAGRPRRRVVPREARSPSGEGRTVDLEALAAGWQRAFVAAGSALRAAGASLPAGEIQDRRVALAREIERTELALRALDALHEGLLTLCG